MKSNLKPADAKARALLKKLQALAERGIDGEKIVAQNKLARLKARFDFSAPASREATDLFSGKFTRATTARRIYSFGGNEFDVANSVKWAIETTANISCVFRDGTLLAEASPATVNRLTTIAEHIACGFRTLIDQFSAVAGVGASDRAAFVMGLYDGMMNDERNAGQQLPGRPRAKKKSKAKNPIASGAPGLNIHPYTIALSLGKQIRFSIPLEQITAELEAVTRKRLGPQV